MLDEVRRDVVRHGGSLRHPGVWLLATHRFGRWAHGLPAPARRVGKAVYGAMSTVCELVLGSELDWETEVGEGLHFIHADGVRIAYNAVLGKRVGIMQGVVIGTAPDRPGAPIIGDDVFIGAGAKILGPVRVGARARVAANSVVISDVPPDATAIGVPAKVLRYTGRASSSRAETLGDASPEPGE